MPAYFANRWKPPAILPPLSWWEVKGFCERETISSVWYFCLVEIAVLEVSCLRGAFTERRNVFVDVGRTWGIYVSTCCVALDHNSTTPLRHREQDLRFGCVWRSRKDWISVASNSPLSSCLWLWRERLFRWVILYTTPWLDLLTVVLCLSAVSVFSQWLADDTLSLTDFKNIFFGRPSCNCFLSLLGEFSIHNCTLDTRFAFVCVFKNNSE